MLNDFRVREVIHAAALHRLIAEDEPERADQVQPCAQDRAGAGHGTRVVRNLWLVQHDLEHEPMIRMADGGCSVFVRDSSAKNVVPYGLLEAQQHRLKRDFSHHEVKNRCLLAVLTQ